MAPCSRGVLGAAGAGDGERLHRAFLSSVGGSVGFDAWMRLDLGERNPSCGGDGVWEEGGRGFGARE